MINKWTSTLAVAFVLSGCVASGPSVGDYAIGDDSAAIKGGRNRASAQITKAEIEQHRRQRANVSEELDLESKKRNNSQEKVNGGIRNANSGISTVNNVLNMFR